MLNLYITRHGETQWNSESRLQGWKDSELTNNGKRNAVRLGERLNKIHFNAIYSSPIERAVKTAKLIRSDRMIPIRLEEGLKEILIEMRWFLYLIPVFFFSYYYGIRIGILTSILSNMIFLTYEVLETHNGEPVTQLETYLDISISLVSLLIAFCIGLMASKLNKLSITDPLTNLFNRRYIESYQIVGKKRPYVLFIDLDRFKFINDSLGHSFGDQILKAVSERLKNQIDKRDIIARIGGDEFVIISNDVTVNNIKKKAKKILNELSDPYEINGNELFLTASIGISNRSENHERLNDLIVKADIAMYKAKLKGKNQYQFFMKEMNEEIMEMTELEKGLHNAVKRDSRGN